jgi:hypothetical protein
LGVGFERCENKGGKSTPKFIPSSNYHQEENTIKSIKANYPSNLKPSFNPKREVRKDTPKPREEAFVCMFYGHAGHLDELCFWRKRNSYRDEFLDYPPRSYSRVSTSTYSRALSNFSHGTNYRSYGFDSRENSFVPRLFGYDPRPHRGDHFLCMRDFPTGGSYTHFEPRHLYNPHFFHGSHPTDSNGKVQKTVKTSLCCMVKCWIS